MDTPFQPGWFSFDLGKYRPCDNTYCFFDYESLPSIDMNQFRGDFHWLPELSADLKEEMKIYQQREEDEVQIKLKQLIMLAEEAGIRLPKEFIFFMESSILRDQIPSCTACYFDLPEHICTFEVEGKKWHAIRFLNDQQDVVLWNLLINDKGESCVLASSFSFDNSEVMETITEKVLLNNVLLCAPTFESFIYRFWLENDIWFELDMSEHLEKPLHIAYLSHYQK